MQIFRSQIPFCQAGWDFLIFVKMMFAFNVRVQKEIPLWALLDPRDPQGHQELVMMAVKVLLVHLDLQDSQGLPLYLEPIGPTNVSVSSVLQWI